MDGTGTFIKIDTKCIIKKNSIISFCDTHIAILFPTESEIESKQYSLSLLFLLDQ